MNYSRIITTRLLILLLVFFFACLQEKNESKLIRGIYGSPKPFWDRGLSLPDLGVNAIFVHSGSINQEMIKRARSEGLKIYAEFATLNGKNYVEDHPEAWAINEKGEKVEAASWFMGVCPTEPGFKQYRMDQLHELITEFELDGVWMDYVHWHAQFEEPEPILPETCFCDHCLQKFSKDTQIELQEGTAPEKAQWILNNVDSEWRDWRCQVIYDWASDIKEVIKEVKPTALLGLYHCPWNDFEFDGARRRILGLDYDLLKEIVDVFSPMVYHGRMGRNPDWVAENIIWFCDRIQIQEGAYPKVWPIVQAYNDPEEMPGEEFESVLWGGLSGRAGGVMMFTSYAVAEDSIKTRIMKNVYGNIAND